MFRSISTRLAAPFLLFLLPVAFLLHAVIDFGTSGIRSARNEITGIAPIITVLDLMTELGVGQDEARKQAAARAASVILGQALDHWRLTPDAARRIANARFLAEQIGSGMVSTSSADALEALGQAVKAIGDASELILDPELPSYYLMDILVNRDAAVLHAVLALRQRREQLLDSGLPVNDLASVMPGYVEALRIQTEALGASFRAIEMHDGDRGRIAQLDSTVGRYFAMLHSLEYAATHAIASLNFDEQFHATMGFAPTARHSVADKLRALLEERIERLDREIRIRIISATVMFAAAAAAMLLLIGILVVRPVKHVTLAMQALSRGDTTVTLPRMRRSDEIGAMARAIDVFRDTAERRRALEAQTRDDAEAMRQLADDLSRTTLALAEAQAIGQIGGWSFRLGAPCFKWSDEVFRLFRMEPSVFEPTRAAVLALFDDDSRRRFLDAEGSVMRGGATVSLDVQARRGDGVSADFTIILKADQDAGGAQRGFVGAIQDITRRKRAERDLEQLAYFDALSGLGNRSLFQRRLMEAIAVSQGGGGFALMILDLDRFKEVNDSLGHQAGDELLFLISDRLRGAVPRDTLLARLGGDEFAVLLRLVDVPAVKQVAADIIASVSAPVALSMGEVTVGASVGIALCPRDGLTDDGLMQCADLALYKAKDAGRGVAIFYDPSFSEIAQEKIRLGRDLAAALGADDQLFLAFQAQVDAVSGRVTGFEALLRWRHPERGMIPPSEFIPIAESSKLICDLGTFVLREACRQIRAWRLAGAPARTVSVNVSPAQLWLVDVEEDVRSALAEFGISPSQLCIEVTESVFARDAEGKVRRALDGLKALGVQLALDDFGTGYSSLGILNQLPFDKIKIDRCFVSNADRDGDKMKLLEGIIGLAHALDKRTVAEGAETMSELLLLTGLGCHEVQGYVFARPLPADEALAHAADIERHFGQSQAA